jgi:Family of unknown function (DUF5317)
LVGLLAPVLLATLLALAWPARERARPHDSRVHWWPAAVGAFLCELALYNPPLNEQPWALHFGPALWLLTRLVLLAVALRNIPTTRWPWLLVTLGLTVNGLVIVLNNGFMPQSARAAAEVWGEHRSAREPARLDNTTIMTEESRLPWLADVIPEPSWLPRANVISIGDLLLSLGIASYAYQAARGRIVGWIGLPVYACVPTARAGRGDSAFRPR